MTEEREVGIPFKRSVFNANHRAYRRLSGLIGFRRPIEFGLYRPRLFSEWPALARPMAYRPAYQGPGPLGTLTRWREKKQKSYDVGASLVTVICT